MSARDDYPLLARREHTAAGRNDQITLALNEIDQLRALTARAAEIVTRSYWVVNEETGGIGYSVDYTDFDALGRAQHWQSVFGPGHRIDLVTHRHWSTPSEQVSRETVVPALAAAGKD